MPFARVRPRLVADGQAVVQMPPVIRRDVGWIDAERFDGVDCQQHALDLRPAGQAQEDFAAVEGANLNVSEHWTDAHLLRGQARISARQYKAALADIDAALNVPGNLPAGLGFGEGASGAMRSPEIAYWTGAAYEAMGNREQAVAAWQKGSSQLGAAERRHHEAPVGVKAQAYYEALCLQKLGQNDKAKELLEQLVDTGNNMLADPSANDVLQPRTRTASAHYLTGLGYLGMNIRDKASSELNTAIQTSPDLIGARAALVSIQ